jgi:hypothetical protein
LFAIQRRAVGSSSINKEAALQALMKNEGVNITGSLFWVEISVANSRMVLGMLWQTKEKSEKVKEEKESV